MEKKLISVVAPMYNEVEIIREYSGAMFAVFSSLREQYDFELLLVNDGSQDATLEQMSAIQKEHPETVTLVNLSRNFGLEGAINAGLRKASGDAVVVMDADLQDPPELIVEMLEKWEHGADIVNACRHKREHDTFFKRKSAEFYYGTLNMFSGKIKLEQNAANYKLMSRKAVEHLLALPEVNSVFRVSVPFLGMRTETVYYERNKRGAGETKYNLQAMIHAALDGITTISIMPLHKLSISIFISATITLLSIVGAILVQDIWRVGFLICAVNALLFTVLFTCLLVIGEYIGQVVIESKRRPISIVYGYFPCDNAKKRGKTCDTSGLETRD
jgi:dolichol-phosphate mannosyltransferase